MLLDEKPGPLFCKCNCNGRCTRCKCYKEGRSCTNCQSLHLNKCKNLKSSPAVTVTRLSLSASLTSPVSVQSVVPPSSSQYAVVPVLSSQLVDVPVLSSRSVDPPASSSLVSVQSVVPASSSQSDVVPVLSSQSLDVPGISSQFVDTPALPIQSVDTPVLSSQFVDIQPLPSFTPSQCPDFKWDELDGKIFAEAVNSCYDEIVHWRRNIFKIPSGKTGKAFVREMTKLLTAFAEISALEGIALKTLMIMPSHLLQKPHPQSKSKDHVQHLDRRLQFGNKVISKIYY